MSSDFKFLCRLLHIHPTDATVLGSFHLEGIKGLIQFNLNIPIVFVCKQLQREVVSQNIILDKYSKSLLSIEGFHYLLNWQATMNNASTLNVNACQFVSLNGNPYYQDFPILSSLPPPPKEVARSVKHSPHNPIRQYKVKINPTPNPTPRPKPNLKPINKVSKKDKEKKVKYGEDTKPKTVPRITFTQDYEEPKKYGK